MTRPSWRREVGGRHWLKQAKTTIISGMGGGSLGVERIGQSRFYTGFSHSASSPALAKVLDEAAHIFRPEPQRQFFT